MEKERSQLILPKPQVSFNKYQVRCAFHTKARCGRCFCNHPIRESKKNVRCTKLNCPFYGEAERLMRKKRSKHEYHVPRRYRSVMV